jgi:hypothetical protein
VCWRCRAEFVDSPCEKKPGPAGEGDCSTPGLPSIWRDSKFHDRVLEINLVLLCALELDHGLGR